MANTRDVVLSVTDVFRGDMMGDCIAAHVARGFIDSRDLPSLLLLPAKLPLPVKCKNRAFFFLPKPSSSTTAKPPWLPREITWF